MSGKAIPSLPGEDGSDEERQALEDKHAVKIAAALRAIMRKVAPLGTTVGNITPDGAVSRYREASSLLRDALVAMLTDGALLGAQVGGQQVEYILGVRKATILGVDWDLINQDALAWVLSNPSQVGQGFGNGYANAVLAAMNTTSEQQLTTLVGEWIRNGLTYNSLIDQMERTVFSRQRASMVAVTEITRAYAAGNQAAWRRSGIIKEMRWRTANDERTCPVCSALNGTVVSIEGDFSGALPDDQSQARGSFMLPPAHVRCRCIVTPYVRVEGVERTEQPRWQPTPDDISFEPRQRPTLPTTSASRLLYEWVNGSNRRTSILLKQAIKQEFGTPGLVMNKRGFSIAQGEIDDVRNTVRQMYDRTQEAFGQQGVATIKLYRGVKSEVRIPGVVESWTTDLETARKFDGYDIMEMVVPVDRVFMHSGGPGWKNGKYGEQYEYMVMADRPKAR